jgi:hypothetical protein
MAVRDPKPERLRIYRRMGSAGRIELGARPYEDTVPLFRSFILHRNLGVFPDDLEYEWTFC